MPETLTAFRSGVGAVALMAAMATTAATADEADAKQILRSMSDYLTAEQSLAFDYDATLEVVTTEDQKLGLATSGTVQMTRPDKIRATRTGGFADIEMVFDGETFSMIGNNLNLYAQMPVSGSVDDLVNTLREDYGRALPAADLLSATPYDLMMSEVTDIKDLGAGVIGGKVCDHLAFRTPDVDWQIWIAQGEEPHPCRYVITTHGVSQGPQYRIDIRDWHSGKVPADNTFEFKAPEGASEITFEEYHGKVSDMPDNYVKGDTQ